MPKFHFFLVSEDGREHMGSMELPGQGELIPAGLQLTTKILATVVRQNVGDLDGLMVQAVDGAGATVYTFHVSRDPRDHTQPAGYVH